MQDFSLFICADEKNEGYMKNISSSIILEDQLTREITSITRESDKEFITIRTYKASMYETILNRE